MQGNWGQKLESAVRDIREGKIERGLRKLDELAKKGELSPERLLELAHLYFELGHLEKAEKLIQPLLALAAAEEVATEAKLLACEIWMERDDVDRAMEVLLELKEKGNDVRIFVLLADLFLMQNLPEVALKYLHEAAAKEPDVPEIQEAIERIYDEYGYLDLFPAGAAARKEGKRGGTEGKRDLKTARALALSGEFEEAYAIYKELTEKEPTSDAWYGYGFLAYQLGKWEEAKQALQTLLQKDPDYLPAYKILADVQRKLGMRAQAIELLRKYSEWQVQDENALVTLAELWLEEGELQEAEEALQKSLERNDENPQAWFMLGTIAEERGDEEKAREYYENCVALSPDAQEAIERSKKLRK
ncbi:hypothetical protein BSNK01_13710 [Bacillaceae bacterium]